MRGRVVVIVLAAIAVAIAFAGSRPDDGGDSSAAPQRARPPANAVTVTFAYSTEKPLLVDPLIERFNRERHEVGGRPVFVDATPIASGEAQERIARGTLEPVAWSPASSLWGRLLEYQADRDLVPDRAPSIVRTPLVIAMWEPMARALGWPRKTIGFADLLELARSGTGWAEFGQPQWGSFKLVHTNPDFSTSGLSAVVAEYYAATGKRKDLTEDDVNDPGTRKVVRDLERSIVHYGDTTVFVEEQLRAHGPGYASAVAMEETTVLKFNRERGDQPKLVALYPEEGTFYSDNPFIVLDGDWVSAEERRGAELFRRFLAEEITPEVAARAGFRPADVKTPPVPPVSEENGVDPEQPARLLGPPEPRVLARIKQTWREDRKPASVLVVLDTSGSMGQQGRLVNAKKGVQAFLAQAARQDRVGLTIFNDEVTPVIPIGSIRENRARLKETVDGLIAEGGTAIYDVTSAAFASVDRVAGDDDRINAVVLLTDGEDTDSDKTLEDVLPELDQGDTENPVRVFTIAYSAEAEGARQALERIARASGGKSYTGDTENIDTVYRQISSFF
jgi:Ca-activated chloride channel family protein